MKRLAVIPARGGSKRIPDKNIRNFCGKPMIAYPLAAARQSGLFDIIHVSTESDRIAQVVESLGFAMDFLRPTELADDFTPLMPVLKYVTHTYLERGNAFDHVCLIMACSPLIEATDLIGGAELFDRFKGKRAVLAVAPYPVPVEWAFERRESGELIPLNPGSFSIRSQDLGAKYYDAGMFSFFSVKRVLCAQGAGSDSDFVGYMLDRRKAIDIDNPEDLLLAEAIYYQLKPHQNMFYHSR